MATTAISEHPHIPLLRSAYACFRHRDHRSAIDILAPILDPTERPSVVAGAIWGLAGDCYFALDEIELGFTAYRQSLTLDPMGGCLSLFAREVVRHHRTEDADFALLCLNGAWQADKLAFRRYPMHFLKHSLSPRLLYFRIMVLPKLRQRLRRRRGEKYPRLVIQYRFQRAARPVRDHRTPASLRLYRHDAKILFAGKNQRARAPVMVP